MFSYEIDIVNNKGFDKCRWDNGVNILVVKVANCKLSYTVGGQYN